MKPRHFPEQISKKKQVKGPPEKSKKALEHFRMLSLSPTLLKALSQAGFTEPTPVQALSLPHSLAGKDLLVRAETGSGKSAAFIWPMLMRLEALRQQRTSSRSQESFPQALILAPTRELAIQIQEMTQLLQGTLDFRSLLCIGGNIKRKRLSKPPEILIATPGRLVEMVLKREVMLERISFVVLDEADRLLEMGFYGDVRRLLRALRPERQTLFFSATLEASVREWAQDILKDPVLLEVSPLAQVPKQLEESFFRVNPKAKPYFLSALLQGLLGKKSGLKQSQGLIFVKTRSRALQLESFLQNQGFSLRALHGKQEQSEREAVLKALKRGAIDGIITTNLAARGLDIPRLGFICHFELTRDPLDYVHRVGRTARIGRGGQSISLVSDEEVPVIKSIMKQGKRSIEEKPLEEIQGFDPDKRYKPLAAFKNYATLKDKKSDTSAVASAHKERKQKGKKRGKVLYKLKRNKKKKST